MAREPQRCLRNTALLLIYLTLLSPTAARGARQLTSSTERPPGSGGGSSFAVWSRGLASQQQGQGQQRCPKVSKELLAARARKNTVMFAVVRQWPAHDAFMCLHPSPLCACKAGTAAEQCMHVPAAPPPWYACKAGTAADCRIYAVDLQRRERVRHCTPRCLLQLCPSQPPRPPALPAAPGCLACS